MSEVGIVYLVGAGPGDPELITVKGLKALQKADVVLYDRLIPVELLDEAPSHAEKIFVGKAPTKHRFPQEEINRLLVEKASQGLTVVRLKGGDPFVFGRGGEEALECFRAGIPFVIVPGITSAVAVPAYAGIPVTHRQTSVMFSVFTGHEEPGADYSSVDYDALAGCAKAGTLVLLMGVGNLAPITIRLIEAGVDPLTPAACIEWGTTPKQRIVEGTLSDIAHVAHSAQISAPALTVIGSVVALRQAGLSWFPAIDVENLEG